MSAFCYDIRYDFMEDGDVLPDWEEHMQTLPLHDASRSATPPKSGAAERIYDGMAGLFIAETIEEFGLEYAAIANFILDNTEAATFLIENEPIRNALQTFTMQMRKEFPAALQLVDAMDAQLDIIGAKYGK
jgi:hypothetical protein